MFFPKRAAFFSLILPTRSFGKRTLHIFLDLFQLKTGKASFAATFPLLSSARSSLDD